jgi:hypothetical protein
VTVSHLDLDRLADLLAGEGSDADVEHVAGCAGCAGRLDELEAAEVEVAAVLAALPPPALPADLAQRIDAAVAAEPALPPQSAAPGPRGDGDADPDANPDGADRAAGSRTVTPFPSVAGQRAGRGAGRRARRRAPLAAAAVLLVAAGAVGGVLVLRGSGRDTTTSASSVGGTGDTATAPRVPTSATGRDYAASGALASALPALLSAPAAAPAAAPKAAAGADPLARLHDPPQLSACLSAIGTEAPVALDYASYGGQPALVVVLPGRNAPTKVDVFVVGADCRPGADGTLFFTRLDRPAG